MAPNPKQFVRYQGEIACSNPRVAVVDPAVQRNLEHGVLELLFSKKPPQTHQELQVEKPSAQEWIGEERLDQLALDQLGAALGVVET